MLEDLEINSFDDLKTALGEALHNGAASPEAAETEVKCVRDARHDSRCEETSLDDLAEAYGDEGACQESCGSRDTEGIPR